MTDYTEPEVPKKLNHNAWLQIRPTIIALFKLRAPAQLNVEYDYSPYARRFRDWLYKYFNEMELKPLYKVTMPLPNRVTIHCLPHMIPKISTPNSFSRTELFYQKHLMNTDDRDSALELCRYHLANNLITDQELLSIMEEWDRQNASPTKRFRPPPLPEGFGEDE